MVNFASEIRTTNERFEKETMYFDVVYVKLSKG